MKLPKAASAMNRSMKLLGAGSVEDLAIRQAAWVARCVGRGHAAPLTQQDLTALAAGLHTETFEPGAVIFQAGSAPPGVWIVRNGRVELSVGSGRKRSVVQLLGPGDVDGDIQHLLDMPLPYTARAVDEATVLFLSAQDFEGLLASRLTIARRWLSSVAERLAASHERIIGMLGRSLTAQVAQLLLEESVHGSIPLPQRTLAAMLGVARPSLNKILKDFERRGLIQLHYGGIDVTDEAGIRTLAE
ncbi:Crp/Fnr family transcriptional regulator [Haloechinothrix halophila]|uniref:Crp/Fnr family transcriptional regulator n=1 Tax=Haloechinothrix halophila TaxID=1069073 RepID=UPI000426B55F|nr:Crp/Fnr family transcriptional regulator [Haloechinothrix halophila]